MSRVAENFWEKMSTKVSVEYEKIPKLSLRHEPAALSLSILAGIKQGRSDGLVVLNIMGATFVITFLVK